MTNIMCCNVCGRANIVCDAAAVWSPVGQIWVLDEVFDEAWCNDCESDVAIVRRPVPQSEVVAIS